MANKFTVSSLPLKDVIGDLSQEMNTSFKEKCTEYILEIPKRYGDGVVRGINFNNGLGIIIYQCTFYERTTINFTVDKVHPLKYLYTANGYLNHQFANESETHFLKARMCALVASEEHNGHILYFEPNKKIDIVSLEIDRKAFLKSSECQLLNLSKELQRMFQDVDASHTFYHDGFYSLEFQQIIDSIHKYEDDLLIRKLHLESTALDIFVEQIQLFEDDIQGKDQETLLRYNELERIRKISKKIDEELDQNLSIDNLSKTSGLNPSKLQKGFKYVFNKTVKDYISSRRLEKAKLLLLTTEKSIASIAMDVGLQSPSYFTKVFKEAFGSTPSSLRKNYDR